ncbi:MAG: RagB/SusD family nutrient uptake outer membrane protein, partial [Segetibacter sp.]|nr:RagB/SusD family nutrient uptake outer membrane protein [Segetibacter sp.]
MINRIKKLLLLIMVLGTCLTACKKEFLNTLPLDKASAATVWADPALSESFVTNIYNGIHDGLLNQESMDCITDNALYNFGKMDIMEANISPSNTGWVNNTYEWGEMYARIRAANLALMNLAAAKFDNANGIIDRLKGETYFLRGYYYNQMLRYYGAVPLIKEAYTLDNPDFTVARNTYEECVNAIIGDLDSAAMLLHGKTLTAGRATEGAALALKARVLLYAASDLHDIPTAKAKSSVIAGFAHPELLGYIDGDRAARWQKAKDAAKAVIDMGAYGYALDLSAPAAPEQAIANYTNAYLSRNGGEKELIFAKYYIRASSDDWGAWYPRNNGPNGYHGWTSSEPTQNLVDNYEMMDGTKFDWNNAAQAGAPYENRDPRFYASILYDGAPWKPRNRAEDPANEIQTGTYFVGSTKISGLDTRQGPIENWNGSFTGYYFRKFIDPDPTIRDATTAQLVPWPFFRFTEAMFNYAEALIELGEDDEARTWLNRIRFRAGMPALTESGDALRRRYRNERRIEMAYEEQRYHDARRWMIAPTTIGRKTNYIVIEGKLKPGATAPTPYRKDKTKFDYIYKPVEYNDLENRTWVNKMYYRP